MSEAIASASEASDVATREASAIVDLAWKELLRSPYVQLQMGLQPTTLPEISRNEARRRSAVGRAILERLKKLDRECLSREQVLTLDLVSFRASTWSQEERWYWHAIDPVGIGLFGLFAPTTYCGGYLLNFVHKQLNSCDFEEPSARDRYLDLLCDYANLIEQMTARTAGQVTRGLRIPKPQIQQAHRLLQGLRTAAASVLRVETGRFPKSRTNSFGSAVSRCLTGRIVPAFDTAIAALSDQYLVRAPDTVGMAQTEEGGAVYAELVKLHTTLDLTPDQVHAKGLERLAEIEASIRRTLAELGFERNEDGLLAHLQQSREWRSPSRHGVLARFQRYMERVTPHLAGAFETLPRASCGVAALPKALQGAMTYGYYDPPKRGSPKGIYRFNPAYLIQRPLHQLASLTYHELVPGHHLQFALQQESKQLHPFRANSFVNAHAEGWAEYAATWAGEAGLYETPEERYGRLAMDAFFTSRLIVDTGLNGARWSLDRARSFMKAHSRVSELEIATETLRYACDIPAQALAYKLGDTQFLAMRARMRRALGKRFSLKIFHSTVLSAGALPLPILDRHVDHRSQRLAEEPRS